MFFHLSKCCGVVVVVVVVLHLHATQSVFFHYWALFFCLFFLCPLTAQNVRGLVGSAERNPCMCQEDELFTRLFCKKFQDHYEANPHDHYEKKYGWPFYNIHEHSANSHDISQTCAKTNYLHDCSAKSAWPLCKIQMSILYNLHDHFVNPHKHSAKFTWHNSDMCQDQLFTRLFCKIIMTIMHIHMTIMQNTDEHSIKSAWPLCKSTRAFCKFKWHNPDMCQD